MKSIEWLYQLRGSREWLVTDSCTLLFRLIPSGNVAAYRVKSEQVAYKALGMRGVQ